jgi:hypothetical protein
MPDPKDLADLSDAIESSLQRGSDWLLRQQSEDGAWRSTTYGQLKEGPAITATVLWSASLSGLADANEWQAAARRAMAFLSTGLKRTQSPSAPDGTLDYPVYAAAMLLIAQEQFDGLLGAETTRKLTKYLVDAQCGPSRQFEATRPDFGGWDLFGSETKGITSGTNVSASRFVLQALALSKTPIDEEVRSRASDWLARCFAPTPDAADGQKRPGGFVFSPEPSHLGNKAEWFDEERTKPRPYGSATCDGLLALVALHGTGRLDNVWHKRRLDAILWLAVHDSVGVDPGFEDSPPEAKWAESLRFYFFAALGEVLMLLGRYAPTDHVTRFAKSILLLQKEDGSWQSEAARMREDDPLIATAFSLVAMGRIRRHLAISK